MQTYSFPYFTLKTVYPESSVQVKFGRGYQFASKPKGPDQVTYELNYEALWFYTLPNGSYDLVKNPLINAGKLDKFYNDHRQYEPFIFPHPALGNKTVRFAEPLTTSIIKGGRGQIEPVTVKLILQP